MTVDSEDIDWTLNETEQIPDGERETVPIPANRPSTSSNSRRDRGRDRYLKTPDEVRRVPSRIRGIKTCENLNICVLCFISTTTDFYNDLTLTLTFTNSDAYLDCDLEKSGRQNLLNDKTYIQLVPTVHWSRRLGTYAAFHCKTENLQIHSGPSPSARVTRSHTRSQREDHRRHQGESKRMIDSSDDHEVFITIGDDNFYSLELFLSGPIQSKSAEVIQETPKVLKSEMVYLSVPINSVLCACNFIKKTPSVVYCGLEMKVELFCRKCVQRQVLHRKEQFAQRNSHQAGLSKCLIYHCV